MRIYPADAVPKTCPLPYVTYERTDEPGIHLMGADAVLHSPTYTVDVFAIDREKLKSVEDVVVTALKDYSGTMGSTTIQRSFYENSYYGGFDSDIGTYNQSIEFTIWHE
jgi:hypothetical protein